MSGPGDPLLSKRGQRVVFAVLVAAMMASAAWVWSRQLGEKSLKLWDESFHAIVARNLAKHPLKPTLIDVPYLPYDYSDWHENHVWMHKPILPLWTIAGSFALLGVDRFALRLPSVILATASLLLTYLIGRRLFDRRTGLIAAAIQASAPVMVQLVQGRLFADHVDVSLLFWTELSILFLLRAVASGRWSDVAICGVAQGCAYLSKSYLALIVTGLSVVAWWLGRRGGHVRAAVTDETEPAKAGRGPQPARSAGWGGGGPGPAPFRVSHVLGILAAAVVTIAPWTIYAYVNYRKEFLYEYAAWWHHLAGEWENWGAPWDRVVFDYLPNLYRVFLAPVLFAAFGLIVPAFREKSFGLLFALAWAAGVFVPHLIAPTKTPTATLIAFPALALLFGALVSRALRGHPLAIAAWGAIAAAAVIHPGEIPPPERGYPPDYRFGMIAAKNPWVLWQIGGAVVGAALLIFATPAWARRGGTDLKTGGRIMGVVFIVIAAAVCCSLILFRWNAGESWRLAGARSGGDLEETGRHARAALPPNAVLLVDGKSPYDHQLAMFHADRTSYSLRGRDANALAAQIRAAGGDPYLVAPPGRALPIVQQAPSDGLSIYRLP